jgi:hypothetical protein
MDRAEPVLMKALLPSLKGWIPVSARVEDGRLWADLCLLEERRFTEPFFDETAGACMREPFHAVFRRRVDAATMAGWLERSRPLPVSGFIFHMSRCGSTLLSQLLAASPENRVMSEPPPVDAALRAGAPGTIDDETRIEWLRVIVGMLAQAGIQTEKRFFVKFDSWHASFLPLIVRAFPKVPWIFLIRHPIEVIVSHLRQPGAQMVPGMVGYTPPGVDPQSAWQVPRAEYCARVLGGLCESVERELVACPNLPARIVDYSDLHASGEPVIWPHFGMVLGSEWLERSSAVFARDSKRPTFRFDADSSAKQGAADLEVREAAQRWAMPVWERLVERSRAAT